jgi:hypothetical protein
MNCRFAPIDARTQRVMRPLATFGSVRQALQHSPGEGSRAPS